MAGIAGIIPKTNSHSKKKLTEAFSAMMSKLAYSERQIKDTWIDEHCYAGNVLPVNSMQNDHYIKLAQFSYHVFVDGLVFVNDKERQILESNYGQAIPKSDYACIPFLVDFYGEDFEHHITGWYNIFVYDEVKQSHLLVNDRFGYLPLYYYDSDEYFIFSSKIEPLLASGLMQTVAFDPVTMAEHLFFNYPLSDHTYIKQVFTLPDASILRHNEFGLSIKRYWNVSEWFNLKPLKKKQSIQSINSALQHSIEKLLKKSETPINFSLTGGWDSRVVLSYLLPKHKDDFNAYSFGASGVDDINIPKFIADKEGFSYTPYTLDEEYLENKFLDNAKDTILLSNGTRNYKRTHYIYAIKQIAKKSNILLTGIFGDEVFKVGKPQGGSVISKNAVDFIDSGFDVDAIVKKFKESNLFTIFDHVKNDIIPELENRLAEISNRFKQYKTAGEQYFAFRFTLNLRKYFGHEVNSYNDFVYCHSPFIDYDFLKEFAKTKYMVSRFPFKKTSLKLKAQSSWLYYKLTGLNQKQLTKYPSSRGFRMKDTNTISGILKIVYSKILVKNMRKKIDGFNTKTTDEKFEEMLLEKNFWNKQSVVNFQESQKKIDNIQDYYSLLYWEGYIESTYLKQNK